MGFFYAGLMPVIMFQILDHIFRKPILSKMLALKMLKWSKVLLKSVITGNEVIMSAVASQITGVWTVCSTDSWGADKRKHQSSASLAFVWGIHRRPVDSPHNMPVNSGNVSIWWRYRASFDTFQYMCFNAPTVLLHAPWSHQCQCVLNHRKLDCLLNSLFSITITKSPKLQHFWIFMDGHRFPLQRASNPELSHAMIHRTHDVVITSFWRNNDVIIA